MKCHHHLAAGICGIALTGIVSTTAAETSHSWNTFEVDFNALGLAAISPTSNDHKAPDAGALNRIASYRVAFSKAGSYDLYVRCIPGAFYMGKSFGETPQWQEAHPSGRGACQGGGCQGRCGCENAGGRGQAQADGRESEIGPKTLEDAKEELAAGQGKGGRGSREGERAGICGEVPREQAEGDGCNPGRHRKGQGCRQGSQAGLPAAIKAAEAAKQAHEKAMAATWKAMDALGMGGILGSDAARWQTGAGIWSSHPATPRGLAEFAEKARRMRNSSSSFSPTRLMIQMLVADGPTGGKFGEAMKIYTDIQKASAKAKDGVFQRLALAVSLGTRCRLRNKWKRGR
jgi:hypothetical protein